MKNVLHIIDSFEYVNSNCFQHQLSRALLNMWDCKLTSVILDGVLNQVPVKAGDFDVIVSCLKQRTLYANASKLKEFLGNAPIVVYDQDPWESYRDSSPYKGAYESIASHINVKAFAVTTKWWADFIASRGLPSIFVPMWVLPEYCDAGSFDNRSTELGFIGKLHPHRVKLFHELEGFGLKPKVASVSLRYDKYLNALSNIKIFVRSEDNPITVDDQPANLNVGLWIKDIEAAARGCFSIRNRADGWESYLSEIKTVLLYDDPSEVPTLVENILRMDANERQRLINETVDKIKRFDRWSETARLLTF